MIEHKQTWWDKEIKKQFNDFKSWVGPTSAHTKVWARDYIIREGYTSILDFGCGMCDDYFEYIKIPDTKWKGVEGSKFLYNNAKELELPVKHANVDNTGFYDSTFEVAYSRHVLEHQPEFVFTLEEMIRVANKLVMHIFFIKPQKNKEIINYNEENNLYHNTYDKNKIEEYLKKHYKVKDFEFKSLSKNEEALIINLKKDENKEKSEYIL